MMEESYPEEEEIETDPWSPCTHLHSWRVCEGWARRYRCAECGILGYEKAMLEGGIKRTSEIVFYLCPKCKGPTTKFLSRKAQTCPKCQ